MIKLYSIRCVRYRFTALIVNIGSHPLFYNSHLKIHARFDVFPILSHSRSVIIGTLVGMARENVPLRKYQITGHSAIVPTPSCELRSDKLPVTSCKSLEHLIYIWMSKVANCIETTNQKMECLLLFTVEKSKRIC